ncbi:MAG: hypothetical protein HIU86_05175 [Acidobacteria bacterium]|nr:hypothetical protein [Acidobacteriota bacterium]
MPTPRIRFFDDLGLARGMITSAVEGCHRVAGHSGLRGQAPSDHPEFAAFLTRIGIDSIGFSPDSVLRATRVALEAEATPIRASEPVS